MQPFWSPVQNREGDIVTMPDPDGFFPEEHAVRPDPIGSWLLKLCWWVMARSTN
jgi:hypothetical protein